MNQHTPQDTDSKDNIFINTYGDLMQRTCYILSLLLHFDEFKIKSPQNNFEGNFNPNTIK